MAWNPSPKVADCREVARRWGVAQVIIFGISSEGEMAMATYGSTLELCACSEKLGDIAFDAMKRFVDAVEENMGVK